MYVQLKMEYNQQDSSFENADLADVPQETAEVYQEFTQPEKSLNFLATGTKLVTVKQKDSQAKKYVRQVNVLAISPQKSSFVESNLSQRQKVSSFSQFSNLRSEKKITAMPLPDREYSWRDQLRSNRSTQSLTRKRAGNTSRDSVSLLAIPLDVSVVGTSDVHNRLYKENETLRQKREQIYDPKQKEREFQRTFSFSPKRLKESDSQNLRSVAQFVEDQEQLRRDQLEKLDQIRQKEAEPFKIVPAKEIDKVKAEETKAKVKQKFEEKKKKLIQESQASFKPTISKKSILIVSDRPSQVHSPLKQAAQEKKQSEETGFKNKKSEEMVYQRFEREFNNVVESVANARFLSKSAAIQVLSILGFGVQSRGKTVAQDQLVDQLLSIGLNKMGKIDSQLLLQLLCEMQQFTQPQKSDQKISKQLFSAFYPLVIQRKAFVRNLKLLKDTQEYRTQLEQSVTLSPKTNTVKTQKILSQTSKLELKLRLSANKNLKLEALAQAPNKQNLEWMKNQLFELEMLDCTFKPKINESTRPFSQPRVYEEPRQRDEKTKNDIDFESQVQECTFRPAISRRKQPSRIVPVSQGDIVAPGHTKIQQPSQLKTRVDQQEQPQEKILQLNVRISDTESRLLVLKNAQTYEQAVRQFCDAGGLDQEQEQTLLTVISQSTGWLLNQRQIEQS